MKKLLYSIAVLAIASSACAAEEWGYVGEIACVPYNTSNVRMAASSDTVFFSTYGAGQASVQVQKFVPAGDSNLLAGEFSQIFDSGDLGGGYNGILGMVCQPNGNIVATADQLWTKVLGPDGTVYGTTDQAGARVCGTFELSDGRIAMPDHFVSSSTTKFITFNGTTGAPDTDITFAGQATPAYTKPHYRDWAARTKTATGQTDELFVAYGGQLYKSVCDVTANTTSAPVPFTSGTFGEMGLANTGVFFDKSADQLIFTNGTDTKAYIINPDTAEIVQTLDLPAADAAAGRDAVVITVGAKKVLYITGPSKLYVYQRLTSDVSDWSLF
ncbi:hypothetical protein GX645_02980 [Candidatus Sumerlaeota bacterium]|nr:hypothetical protein [Candidatus Sumerlaeota bacterium]